jgi:Tectonin domain
MWIPRPGQAKDIGVGADGTVWVIGSNSVGAWAGNYGIYRWTGSAWEAVDDGGARIAVDPDGLPWIVTSGGDIYRRVVNTWVHYPGLARDIGVGADGSVWMIGTDHVGTGNDGRIYKLKGKTWERIPGGGVRIAVGPDGMPWVVNSSTHIFRYDGNSWIELPGRGKDIGVGRSYNFTGPDSSAWVIGTELVGRSSDFGIYVFDGEDWSQVEGGAVTISVGPYSAPWIVNSAGKIFEWSQ